MPIAELVLDSSPPDFGNFFFKSTDQHTSLVVLVASKDQFKRLLESAGGSPGLYILQAEDSTVYVGKSVDLSVRLRNHKTNEKIGQRRVMLMMRYQGLSRYLDYGEAKLYDTLSALDYRLEQSPLSSSLEVKRLRLESMDAEHVAMADGLVKQFLSYSVALGLTRPATPPPPPPVLPPPPSPIPSATSTFLRVLTPVGTVIAEVTAAGTFVAALVAADLTKVAGLGYVFAGEPLVSKTKSTKYPFGSKPAGGQFVMTHCKTPNKKRMLERVSDALGLGWTV
ncbi:hypothetical protein [Rubrivivax benzoatilyticus]|uniref:GIY-YIG domain-containing protein n=1 Tax=Rubrivivax benzoatilyticus TaxID=316997 RepID=A0ABX0HTP5_9BURK|nr:hypothetical protein [Rubrivivax benzoatilyticus]EGJ11217.1 hypothetical protein RBXJA2T_12852 [Rubrivivax benzoatilyticus JA2 = ATCC BAA-35]NHK97681.1 hypothetical protein [Rubrivivax benzoatilyticus]NHL22624.1 hypothetical protein [Rubrivivax benzoatilyticus]